jgi:RNA polymerase sigma-70 factor (ECF subfamily)
MSEPPAETPQPDSRRTSPSLLQRARERQPGAWERLVDLYGPLVRYWCRRGGVAADDVDDLAQEAFAHSFASLGSFSRHRPSDTFRGWLRTITRRRIIDHHRREQRHIAAAGGTDALRLLMDQPDAEVEPDMEERNLCDQVYQRSLECVRSEFEPRTWTMFWRTVVDDVPTAVVAADLGVSSTAVRQSRSRVMRRIREEIGDLDLNRR